MKNQRIKRSRVIGRAEIREETGEIFRRMRLTTLTRVLRRQRRGQRRLKNEFIFNHESRNTLKVPMK